MSCLCFVMQGPSLKKTVAERPDEPINFEVEVISHCEKNKYIRAMITIRYSSYIIIIYYFLYEKAVKSEVLFSAQCVVAFT